MAPAQQLGSDEWVSKARNLDFQRWTELGTLNHLPPEIRQQIWRMILSKCSLGDPFYVSCYYLPISCNTIFSTAGHLYEDNGGSQAIGYVRLASATIRNEIDHVFLSTRTFYFSTPIIMTEMWDSMGTDRRSIRSICIDVSVTQNNSHWFEPFASIPRELRSLAFEIDLQSSPRASSRYAVFETNVSVLVHLKREATKRAPKVAVFLSYRHETMSSDEFEQEKAAIEAVMRNIEDQSLLSRSPFDNTAALSRSRLKHHSGNVKSY